MGRTAARRAVRAQEQRRAAHVLSTALLLSAKCPPRTRAAARAAATDAPRMPQGAQQRPQQRPRQGAQQGSQGKRAKASIRHEGRSPTCRFSTKQVRCIHQCRPCRFATTFVLRPLSRSFRRPLLQSMQGPLARRLSRPVSAFASKGRLAPIVMPAQAPVRVCPLRLRRAWGVAPATITTLEYRRCLYCGRKRHPALRLDTLALRSSRVGHISRMRITASPSRAILPRWRCRPPAKRRSC